MSKTNFASDAREDASDPLVLSCRKDSTPNLSFLLKIRSADRTVEEIRVLPLFNERSRCERSRDGSTATCQKNCRAGK